MSNIRRELWAEVHANPPLSVVAIWLKGGTRLSGHMHVPHQPPLDSKQPLVLIGYDGQRIFIDANEIAAYGVTR